MQIARDSAETIALQALGWLAAHDELLPVFLGATGAAISDLRDRAEEPEFLGSVLDFLLMDDAWVVEFAHHAQLPPERVAAARAGLPGGEQVNWT